MKPNKNDVTRSSKSHMNFCPYFLWISERINILLHIHIKPYAFNSDTQISKYQNNIILYSWFITANGSVEIRIISMFFGTPTTNVCCKSHAVCSSYIYIDIRSVDAWLSLFYRYFGWWQLFFFLLVLGWSWLGVVTLFFSSFRLTFNI